jgi:uncharacterized protein
VARVHPEEQDFDPDSFGPAQAAHAFDVGVQLFNDGRYKDAHEQFERGWLASEGPDADFHKGLIQACICLHHLTEGNPDGARKLYRGHRRLLGPYLPTHRGLDLADLLTAMQRYLAPVLRARPGEDATPEGPPPHLRHE